MSSFWKKAWVSAEVVVRTSAPVTHPVVQEARLEPAMTPTQAAQQVERERRDTEMAALQLQEERGREAAKRPQARPRAEASETRAPERDRSRE